MTAFASAVAGAERVRRGLSASFDVFALAIRLYIAHVFFLSGLTKIRDWDSTLFLFTEEYKVPLLPPDLAAYAGTAGELVLPVLLVLGLAGRFGALGLFILNAVAVISYPGLAAAALKDHFLWGALLLVILLHGPGKLSADALIWPRLLAKTN